MVDVNYSCTVCSIDLLYVCDELKQVGMGCSDPVLQLVVEPFNIVAGPRSHDGRLVPE